MKEQKTRTWLLDRKILVACFVITVGLNYFYGSLLWSKVFRLETSYSIGKDCSTSLTDCENTYFKTFLDQIDQLSNAPRTFFSSVIIKDDRVGYSGSCPCPYFSDTRGYSCGGRSSYSKGGQISYCYDSDVSDAQIAAEKASELSVARSNLNDAVQSDVAVYNEHYTFLLILIVYGVLAFRANKRNAKQLDGHSSVSSRSF